MQLIGLFSGIGGFELAGDFMGWKIIASVEKNKMCQRVLKYYWPNAYHHAEVETLDYEEIKKRLDPKESTIVVGGFPCQPWSLAGLRKGKADARNLWPYCIKTVRILRPKYCVFENVFGLINWNGGVVLDEIITDLETAFKKSVPGRQLREEGYEVLCFILPACGVGAPHQRYRIFFVAYSDGKHIDLPAQQWKSRYAVDHIEWYGTGGNVTDTNLGIGPEYTIQTGRLPAQNGPGPLAESVRIDGKEVQTETGIAGVGHKHQQLCPPGNAANTDKPRPQGNEQRPGSRKGRGSKFSDNLTDWTSWPTEPPICSRNDGLSDELDDITISTKNGRRKLNKIQGYHRHRQASIAAFGNAVVPQLVIQIFKTIEAYEHTEGN